ncbi:trifunctional hydroxymethylpyrimidine kinase/phosphomethylpyrimidine kinase/thiaminase Ecym_5248 [Eremothecium cymbalariae DBVPG|uniref:Pyridoxamine kinase/Phosphomethylpyrimidine kinase domain-containing protein n=1 Tax=Eremothecium cymbalariae (strain CBS 270.75 / DBVPG 7215 / KCTC 17166 / NRRL Y-17582) TaxID=931890 RepID=I6ND72_ERECY|nr:hypothetical protein Ecym_5248 [Eremothecium cymbalariae DBVPG\
MHTDPTTPTVLTIAGSDPSGGAGIEADIKTITAHGCYAMTCITAITVQTPRAVHAVSATPPDTIAHILQAIMSDMRVDVIKTGMLTPAATQTLLHILDDFQFKGQLVVDPVMTATSGAVLFASSRDPHLLHLLKRATLVTPNIPEALALLGRDETQQVSSVQEMEHIAKQLLVATEAPNILLKGGHCPLDKPPDSNSASELQQRRVADILVTASGDGTKVFESRWIKTKNTHGTGCTLASAIASNLACGDVLESAVRGGLQYVQTTIELEPWLAVTKVRENGPVNHMYHVTRPRPGPGLLAAAAAQQQQQPGAAGSRR